MQDEAVIIDSISHLTVGSEMCFNVRLHVCVYERLSGRLTQTHCSLSCSGSCRTERSQSVCAPCKLQLEDCLSAELVPTPELIQGYVKKVGKLSKWWGDCPTNSESISFFTTMSNIFWAIWAWAQMAQSASVFQEFILNFSGQCD